MKRTVDSYEPLRRLLRGYEVNASTLARVLRCSQPTALSRIRNPGSLTYSELRCICIGCGVPADELREALRFGRGGT